MRVIFQVVNAQTGRILLEGEQEFDGEKSSWQRIDLTTDEGVTIVTQFDPPIMQRPAGIRRAGFAIAQVLFRAAMQSLEEGNGIHTRGNTNRPGGDPGSDTREQTAWE